MAEKHMWDAKFPPINEEKGGNNEEKGGNNFHVSSPPGRHAPGRAEDERVLDMLMEMSANYGSMSGPALNAARAAVLARMQPVGEVYEVTDMHNQTGIRARVIKVPPQEFSASDKVRVSKVEGV